MKESIIWENLTNNFISTGDSIQYENFSFPLHIHPCTEFFTILSGEMKLLTGKTILMREGDAVLISPLVIHGYESDGPVRFCSMVFEDSVFPGIENMEKFSSGSFCYLFRISDSFPDGELDDVIKGISHYNKEKIRPNILMLYCRLLLTMVLDHIYSPESMGKLYVTDDKVLISQIIEDNNNITNTILPYIRAHYKEKISLNDLAQSINSNRYTVSRTLSKSFGTSFSDLVNRYRIQEACSLLRKTTASILEISLRVGYDTISTFNRNFNKYVGKTPHEYRIEIMDANRMNDEPEWNESLTRAQNAYPGRQSGKSDDQK